MEVSDTVAIIIFSVMLFLILGIPILSAVWFDMGGKELVDSIIRFIKHKIIKFVNCLKIKTTKTDFDILKLRHADSPTYVVRVIKYYWLGLRKRTYYLGRKNSLVRSIHEAIRFSHDKFSDPNQFLHKLKNELRSILRIEPEQDYHFYDVVYSHADSEFDHRRAADIISDLQNLDDVEDKAKVDQLLEELNRISK